MSFALWPRGGEYFGLPRGTPQKPRFRRASQKCRLTTEKQPLRTIFRQILPRDPFGPPPGGGGGHSVARMAYPRGPPGGGRRGPKGGKGAPGRGGGGGRGSPREGVGEGSPGSILAYPGGPLGNPDFRRGVHLSPPRGDLPGGVFGLPRGTPPKTRIIDLHTICDGLYGG